MTRHLAKLNAGLNESYVQGRSCVIITHSDLSLGDFMTALDDAFAEYTDARESLIAARGTLRGLEQGVFGSDGSGEVDNSYVLFDPGGVGSVIVGIEGVLFAIEQYANRQVAFYETRIDLRWVLDTWSRSITDALSATSSTERIARIAEVLPGLGTSFRRANIDELLGEAADTARGFQREIGRIDTAYTESYERWQSIESNAQDAQLALGVLGTAITAFAYAQNGFRTGDWSPRLLRQSADSANAAEDDPRLVNAITAWSDRFFDAADPFTAGQRQLQEAVDAVEAQLETVVERLSGLEDVIDRVEDLIGTLSGLPAALEPFTDVLGAVAAPFDAIFDFLESPPRVFGVPIFPSISRADIDEIVDFLSGISDFIFGFLDPILDPLLRPVQDALGDVFARLLPIRGFVDPMNDLDALLADLRDAVTVFDGLFDPITEAIADLGGLPDFIEEIETPDAGETRVTFFGGDGHDVILGRVLPASAEDGPGIGGAVLWGNGGNDRLTGTEAADMLAGGDGDDRAWGLGADDVMFGHVGDDRLFGDDGNDIVTGNTGNDLLDGGAGDDDMAGNAGNDLMRGGTGADDMVGGSGLDTLLGGTEADRLTGGGDADRLIGGEGDDTVLGNDGDDMAKGNAGDDLLRGGAGDDTLEGGSGDDTVVGAGGDDEMAGNGGSDRLVGGEGQDTAAGGTGDDTVLGGTGDDDLSGDGGRDLVLGGAGNDRIDGGSGADILVGGDDADLFVFSGTGDGNDTIRGFAQGEDQIEIAGAAFSDLTIDIRNGHTFITYGGGDVIKLTGVGTELIEADFLF